MVKKKNYRKIIISTSSFISVEAFLLAFIKKLSNNSFIIVLALAGFSSNDLIIEATSSELVVCGNGDKDPQHEYIHKGIAKLAITKTFRLANNVRVNGAEFKDGLLSIHLYREEPKKETPQKIPIKS